MPLPKPGRLERVTQGWLGRLLGSEQAVLDETARAYRIAARALVPKWQEAYRLLQAAKAAGYDDAYLSGYIWREQRLATMLAQMGEIFEPLGQATGRALTQGQREAISLAMQSVTDTMALATGTSVADVVAGLGISFPQASFERMIGTLTDGSPVIDLSRRYGEKGPAIVREALLQGVAAGESPRKVAARINKALGDMYGDSSTLVRTEMLRTYRESTRATYLANQRYVKGWIWCSALDTRTCPVCWAMHGTKHPLSEAMATHPVCRCSMMPDIIFRRLGALPDPVLGTQSFRALDEASQIAILGPLAQRAYSKGLIDLPALVRETYSPTWGAGRAQRSLATAIGPQRVAELTKELRAERLAKALATPKPERLATFRTEL